MRYFLGADVGGTRTRVWIAGEDGRVVGQGEAGPGNHEIVGYDGLVRVLEMAAAQALHRAGLTKADVAGAGFGVAGYDWPSERLETLAAIARLELPAPVEAVNDALIGLLAGAEEGWGVAVVSGTGCNCRGWDRTRQRLGGAIGAGLPFGEGAGASEIVAKAVEALADEWCRRGPATRLAPALVRHTGSRDLAGLLEALAMDQIELTAAEAPLVIQVAAEGDPVALDILRWAGCKLGELAAGCIRQLEFEDLEFDVVQVGSLYASHPLIAASMRPVVLRAAPKARLVRLSMPPVAGAVLLGMEASSLQPTPEIRAALAQGLA